MSEFRPTDGKRERKEKTHAVTLPLLVTRTVKIATIPSVAISWLIWLVVMLAK